MRAAPAYLTDEAQRLLVIAKTFARLEGADQLHPKHLFQACVAEIPDVVTATLRALAPTGLNVDALVDAIRRGTPTGTPELEAPLAVAQPVSAIVKRARDVATASARAPNNKVTPRYLWASTCVASASLKPWLLDCGWPEDLIDRLPEDPSAALTPDEENDDADRAVLDRFCRRDLTKLARVGKLSSAVGMSAVRQQLIDVLLKKNKRSAVLTGPAGVGKTKLAEDLSVAIARGDVPYLSRCSVYEFDLVQFAKGTHLVGAIEERLSQLTSVLEKRPDEIVLFIDELHMVVGLPMSGGGAMNLANALKPLLDCGLRLIGATTTEEYQRYIEGDAALSRRFTEVRIAEPDRDSVLAILRGVAPEFEEHHHVTFPEDAICEIYEAAWLYAPNLAFPAKGVDLMDEVGSQIRARRDPQSDTMVRTRVRPEDVRDAFRRVRGVDPRATHVELAQLLKDRVQGQDEAAERLSDLLALSRFRGDGANENRPRLAVLFVGPPGVGKSHMARCLSAILFPGRDALLTIDMTEFAGGVQSGEHTRFRLLGPPPPYVGWEHGGLLTRHALQYPHAVVLVDELEKGSDEARAIFLRILNDGCVQDGRGRHVSFRHMHFIFSANAASDLWETLPRAPIGFQGGPAATASPGNSESEVRAVLRRGGFAPEFLSRLSQIVVFRHLSDVDLTCVVAASLRALADRALTTTRVLLDYDEAALSGWVVAHTPLPHDCRRVQATLEWLVETPIARWHLGRPHREPVILRLAPDGDRVRMVAEDDSAKVDDTLFDRMQELLTRHSSRRERERAAQVLIGGRD